MLGCHNCSSPQRNQWLFSHQSVCSRSDTCKLLFRRQMVRWWKVRVSWRSYDFHVKSVLISCQLSNCLNQENCSGLQRLSCTEPILKMAPKVRKAAYLVSNVGLRGLFRALTTLSFDPFKSQGQHAQVPIKLPCLWMPFSVGHICTVVTHLVLTDPVVYRYHVWGTVTCWFVCN